MSGFAFSHQFSQRWLATSPPIKQTIIQELDDIVTLLQPETDLDSYRFSVPNLHDKVEQLMAIEAIRQEKILAEERKREREERERLERERLEQQRLKQERLEQERLEQERLEQQRLENERLEKQRLEQQREQQRLEQERLEQERLEQQQAEQQRVEQDRAEIAQLEHERTIAKQANSKANRKNKSQRKSSELVYAISDSQTAIRQNATEKPIDDEAIALAPSQIITSQQEVTATDTALTSDDDSNMVGEASTQTPSTPTQSPHEDISYLSKQSDIAAIKQQITEQLQTHIDTYLQESMAMMKADLAAWLSEEVDKQLANHLAAKQP